jgi:hypothetical protein
MLLDTLTVDNTLQDEPRTNSNSLPQYLEPPCTGCQFYKQCQTMKTTCNAWNQYIRQGWWLDESIGTVPNRMDARRL